MKSAEFNPPPIDLIVPPEAAGLRLDLFLVNQLGDLSRSRIQRLIRDGAATINGSAARPRDAVRAGDDVRLVQPPIEKIDNAPEAIPLEILFQDDDLLVINKPAGLVVHPGAG